MSYSFAGRFYNKHKHLFPYECDDYVFKIDLEYGELYFTRKLISFSGKHLPLNLFLKYVQRHVNLSSDFLHADTGFPRGFKTNFHVFLEYDFSFSGYKYEDMDGYLHEFKLADNSSTLYFDTFGSGLMLTIENNGYKVFDDDGNYQLFDSYGRLTLIHLKITTSHYAEQSVSYEDNDNVAYDILNPINQIVSSCGGDNSFFAGLMDQAANVEFGASIYSDERHGIMGFGMKALYTLNAISNGNLLLIIWDLIAGGGWHSDKKN